MQQQSGDAQFGQQTGKDFKRTFEEKKDRKTGKKIHGIFCTEKLATVKNHPKECYSEYVQEIYSFASYTLKKMQRVNSRVIH